MEVLYPRCCVLDVHKSSITACVLIAQSGKPLKHIRRFGCTTRELRELVLWLQEFGVEHVAMESTMAAPAEPRTPNLHRANEDRSLRVRMEAWRQWPLGLEKHLVQEKRETTYLTPTGLSTFCGRIAIRLPATLWQVGLGYCPTPVSKAV